MAADIRTGLRVNIYRSGGDFSNGGVSSRGDRLTIVEVAEDRAAVTPVRGPSTPSEEAPAARLVVRHIGGQRVLSVEPADRPHGATWYMFGGCYVATSDSRWTGLTGAYGAVALHDRTESPELSRALSL